MPNKFISDYNDLTQAQFSAKYIAPVIVGAFLLLLLGQLGFQLCSADQLKPVSGRVSKIETAVVSYTHHRGSRGSTPDYATAITLNNQSTYYIQYVPLRKQLDALLHINDTLTIYRPDKLLEILSTGMVSDVAQLKRGTQIIYNFDEEKHRAWLLVGVFAVMITVFSVFIYVNKV